jgi:hypothetical protein
MRSLFACFLVFALAIPALTQEDEEYGPKPPDEEFKLAMVLTDQGKYEDAVKHFKNVLKHFEKEDPATQEERDFVTVAQLHVTAYQLRLAMEEGRFPCGRGDLCKDWVEAIFPAMPRAVGEQQASGKVAHVRNAVDVRKLLKEEGYSGVVVGAGVTTAAAQQLSKWIQEGRRALVQDAAASLFGFTVAPLDLAPDARVTIKRDPKARDVWLLADVVDLSLPSPTAGWCVTGHATAKPLLTLSVTIPGQPAPPLEASLCAIVKLGKGEVIFCNGQLNTQEGDGAVLYRNLEKYLATFPGAEEGASGTKK